MNKTQEKLAIMQWLQQNYPKQAANYSIANLSDSYLRAETPLGVGGDIKFEFLRNSNSTPVASERLLKNNDTFIVTHIGFALKKVGVVAANLTDALQVQALLHYFANPNVFDGAVESVTMASIYNASLGIGINNVDFMPNMPMQDYERIHTSQQGDLTGYAPGVIGRSENPNGMNAYYPSDWFAFDGLQKVTPVINLGASVDLNNADPITETNYGVLRLKGYLASNFTLGTK